MTYCTQESTYCCTAGVPAQSPGSASINHDTQAQHPSSATPKLSTDQARHPSSATPKLSNQAQLDMQAPKLSSIYSQQHAHSEEVTGCRYITTATSTAKSTRVISLQPATTLLIPPPCSSCHHHHIPLMPPQCTRHHPTRHATTMLAPCP